MNEPVLLTIKYTSSNTLIRDSIQYSNTFLDIDTDTNQQLNRLLAAEFLNDSTVQFNVEPNSTNLIYGASPAGFYNLNQISYSYNNKEYLVFSSEINNLKNGPRSFLHVTHYFDAIP